MERICPFLATTDDGRTVVDGYDRAHICRAGEEPVPVERQRQQALCLDAAHRSCERYVEALRRRGPVSWPAPAPDAAIVQTRLVLPAVSSRLTVTAGAVGPRGRRWLIGGAVATIGVAAVATGVAGSLGGVVTSQAPSPTAAPSPTIQPTPLPTAAQSVAPSASPTPAPTATPSAVTTPAPTATPAPQPDTYIVQPGDSLSSIASRFGTTAQAIADANGIAVTSILNIGQVLIIP